MAFRPDFEDFGAFYERTYQVAYRTALGIVCEAAPAADVTQEAYAVAWRHHGRFDGHQPGHPWLHQIVVETALSALRRRRPTVHELALPAGDRPGDQRRAAERRTLFDALHALPPRQRAAVVLRYYHDYDDATIGQILRTTSTDVGAMLGRALDRMDVGPEPTPVAVAGRRPQAMTGGHDTDGALRALAPNVLGRETGPHPTWVGSPAARRVETGPRAARRAPWPIPMVAIALVLFVGVAVLVEVMSADRPSLPFGDIADGWIAYALDGDIHLTREGGTDRRVAGGDRDGVTRMCPAFSPDGGLLAWAETTGPADAATGWTIVVTGLGRVGVPTGPTQRIAVTGGLPGRSVQRCFGWSPDSRRLAFISEPPGDAGVEVTDLDGHVVLVFVTAQADPSLTSFAWSPDGSTIAVVRDLHTGPMRASEIWLVSVAGGGFRRLVSGGPDEVFRTVSWSPDGSWIAVGGDALRPTPDLDVASSFVRMIAVGGPGPAAVDLDTWTSGTGSRDAGPVWSPDGSRLAWVRGTAVVVAGSDGTRKRVLSRVEMDGALTPAAAPGWSPDGAWLLFVGASGEIGDPGTRYRLIATRADGDAPPVALSPWTAPRDCCVPMTVGATVSWQALHE
jgi:RNA polymerase sigma factor (sigma-70 family)